MADNEMKFAILGPSGSGKTTLLACMAQEFAKQKPGMIIPSGETMASLLKAYRALKDEADNPRKLSFERPIEPSRNQRDYAFTINGKRASMPVKFYDFPGEWMNPGSADKERVINIVKDATVIIIAVNTPYLMDDSIDTIDKDNGCAIEEIAWAVESGLAEDKSGRERLILFVPIKCERYLETPAKRTELVHAVKGAFQRVRNLASDPRYKLAMAILPVQTVGSVKFWHFKRGSDGRIAGEVYRKEKSSDKFNPVNVDQPLRYVMSFLIEQSARDEKRASWWRRLFHRVTFKGDLMEVAEYIRSGIKSNNDLEAGFDIFCGKYLIGFKH